MGAGDGVDPPCSPSGPESLQPWCPWQHGVAAEPELTAAGEPGASWSWTLSFRAVWEMAFLQLLAHNPDHIALLADISGSTWSPAADGLGPDRPIPAADRGWLPVGQAAHEPALYLLPTHPWGPGNIRTEQKPCQAEERTAIPVRLGWHLSVCPSRLFLAMTALHMELRDHERVFPVSQPPFMPKNGRVSCLDGRCQCLGCPVPAQSGCEPPSWHLRALHCLSCWVMRDFPGPPRALKRGWAILFIQLFTEAFDRE